MPGKQTTLKRISSPVRKDFEGEKVPLNSLINCDFVIEDFVEMDTEYGHTALVQIEVEKEKRTTFISNPYLIKLMTEYRDNGDLPALATLRKGQGQGNREFYYFE